MISPRPYPTASVLPSGEKVIAFTPNARWNGGGSMMRSVVPAAGSNNATRSWSISAAKAAPPGAKASAPQGPWVRNDVISLPVFGSKSLTNPDTLPAARVLPSCE